MPHLNPPGRLSEGSLRNVHSHKDLRGKKAVEFLEKIKIRYPNARKTPKDLRAIEVLPDQRGPIQGLRPPIDSHRCLFKDKTGVQCDFVTKGGEWAGSKHWYSHKVPRGSLKRPDGKKGSAWDDGFVKVVGRVQSFGWDSGDIRLFELPPWEDPTESAGKLSINTGTEIDAGDLLHQEHLRLFGPPKSAADVRSKSTVPFFINSGAADFVALYDPKSMIELAELPRKEEPLLLKLRDVAITRCLSGCKAIRCGNPVIRRLLRTSLPWVLSHFFRSALS